MSFDSEWWKVHWRVETADALKEIKRLKKENKRLRIELNAHPCLTNRPKE